MTYLAPTFTDTTFDYRAFDCAVICDHANLNRFSNRVDRGAHQRETAGYVCADCGVVVNLRGVFGYGHRIISTGREL